MKDRFNEANQRILLCIGRASGLLSVIVAVLGIVATALGALAFVQAESASDRVEVVEKIVRAQCADEQYDPEGCRMLLTRLLDAAGEDQLELLAIKVAEGVNGGGGADGRDGARGDGTRGPRGFTEPPGPPEPPGPARATGPASPPGRPGIGAGVSIGIG